MSVNIEKLTSELKLHEGLRLKSYRDSVGVWTIGYGRNLQQMKITKKQAGKWLEDDIKTATKEIERAFPHIMDSLNYRRQEVLIRMSFNLGISRLKGFKEMWKALRKKDFITAAAEMLDSKWARKDVGRRANKLAKIMLEG